MVFWVPDTRARAKPQATKLQQSQLRTVRDGLRRALRPGPGAVDGEGDRHCSFDCSECLKRQIKLHGPP